LGYLDAISSIWYTHTMFVDTVSGVQRRRHLELLRGVAGNSGLVAEPKTETVMHGASGLGEVPTVVKDMVA
jgi:hypothetical protein